MKNQDFIYHVRGESKYIDDAPVPEGTLYASIYRSPSAHARILSIDTTEAYLVHGVQKIILAKDIIGVNQIGGIIADEPLLAENEVHYMGQPVAVVLASNLKASREASGKISINLENLPVITEPREAFNNNQLIIPPRIFSAGDTDSKWKDCDIIVEGTAESGAQEHLYLETQGALAFCQEGGNIKIISSTQAPTAVQRAVSRVTGLPMNRIEVEVLRLGGAFGGKEDQANSFAAMAALASVLTKKPVKLVLSRQEDMQITGKRHPYSSNFKIGLSADGKILAYEVTFYQNAGAAADLSPAILDRTLFHCANSYFIPDLKATGYSCRTNLPPNTAFRGFGGPQGMFAIEAAIYKAAEKMGVDASEIQKKNLLDEGDFFHYGQKAENCFARRSWTDASKLFNVQSVREEIRNFNRQNKLLKKGMALMPVCFGISFTNTFMNQASALVHVYSDGSISVSTAAVEMGQGVNMKIR
ncbi:MAG: molybdopterin cofactor-binding domain-containing protein, partial [Ignavibacteriales bacterium]